MDNWRSFDELLKLKADQTDNEKIFAERLKNIIKPCEAYEPSNKGNAKSVKDLHSDFIIEKSTSDVTMTEPEHKNDSCNVSVINENVSPLPHNTDMDERCDRIDANNSVTNIQSELESTYEDYSKTNRFRKKASHQNNQWNRPKRWNHRQRKPMNRFMKRKNTFNTSK